MPLPDLPGSPGVQSWTREHKASGVSGFWERRKGRSLLPKTRTQGWKPTGFLPEESFNWPRCKGEGGRSMAPHVDFSHEEPLKERGLFSPVFLKLGHCKMGGLPLPEFPSLHAWGWVEFWELNAHVLKHAGWGILRLEVPHLRVAKVEKLFTRVSESSLLYALHCLHTQSLYLHTLPTHMPPLSILILSYLSAGILLLVGGDDQIGLYEKNTFALRRGKVLEKDWFRILLEKVGGIWRKEDRREGKERRL